MEGNATSTDVDANAKPLTSSQEDKLLEDENSVSSGCTQTVVTTTAPAPAANLTDLKNMMSANKAAGGGGLLMSLHSGVVTVEMPHGKSRRRSKERKLEAKRKGSSMVNPHDRIKNDSETGGTKRPREIGGTPPGALQPNKKQSASLGSGAGGSNQGVTKSQKKNQKKKLKLLEKKQQQSSSSTVEQLVENGLPVPPPTQGSGSNGSGELLDTNAQPNAGAPTGATAPLHTPMALEIENPSYAQVTDNLCVAVIDQRNPGQMLLLDQKRFDKLNSLLTDTIMQMIGKNTELPVFDDTRLHGGAMRIRCANVYTRNWLELNVPKLDAKKLWPGAKVVMLDFKDLPKPHKFNVFFRGIQKSPKDIFRLLETQNKGIITNSWSVLNCKQRDGGTSMTIGVGQESFEMLRSKANSLYCGMGKATFAVVKSCKENKAYTQNATSSNEGVTNHVGSNTAGAEANGHVSRDEAMDVQS